MSEFVQALLRHDFLRYALLTGLLASVAAGVMGTYVVTRRITYLAAAIAHFVLGGMGAARYLALVHGWTVLTPLHGALFAAVLAATVVALVSLRSREREDTVIGALWAVGMAAGILFISRTPGYNEDLMSYLFGNILLTGGDQLASLALLDGLILATALGLHKAFQGIGFDAEYARIRGVPTRSLYVLLVVLVALTVVVLTAVVGIVLVIALLTLPAAAAGRFTRRLGTTMALATLLAALFTVGGLAASYEPDLPAGATIILIAGAGYLVSIPLGRLFTRLRGSADDGPAAD